MRYLRSTEHRLRAAAGLLAALLGWVAIGVDLQAAEKVFDFTNQKPGDRPAGFRSAVTGEGQPGDWRVANVDLEPASPAGVIGSAAQVQEAVVEQSSRDATDEHFPLLIYEGDTYGDFTLTARVRMLEGTKEQMAGLVFRLQDERNYYVLRLSALGQTARFYKFVDGIRSSPIGPEVPVPRGAWLKLAIECQANQIRCSLDGRELFPALTDNSFAFGRIGLWTKSDSVSQFADLRIVYTPREPLGQKLVQRAMADNPRLLGLRLYASRPGTNDVRLIASSTAGEMGTPASRIEADVARTGSIYYGKEKGEVSVVMPLRDRNGDAVAAVRVLLKPVLGQTRDHALQRARPIVLQMQAALRSQKDLFD